VVGSFKEITEIISVVYHLRIYTKGEKYFGINLVLEYSLYCCVYFKSLKELWCCSLVILQLFSLRFIERTLNGQPRYYIELEEETTYIGHDLLGALIVCNTQDMVSW